jgi:dienelactone hydrolase
MTRREALALPLLSAIRGEQGPERRPSQTAREIREPHFSLCLPNYLRELARSTYERRSREIAQLSTAAAIARRQKWVRETFWTLAGGRPDPTPLNTRTVGSLAGAGFQIERLVYESRPGFFVTANLYLPAGAQGRSPAVLFNMGHYWEAKAYPNYQRCCQGLAKLGYVVLGFDPMGQGERIYYPDSSGRHSRLPSCDAEHTVPGKQMLLFGRTCSRMQVWDAVRSLDVLASHPAVDPRRIGATGHSGGGTLTMLLAAVDERLAAAAIIMGNTENVACRDFHPPGSTDDAEQNLVGSGPLGFDRWDLLYPLAPKPLLVFVTVKDAYATYSPEYIADGREEFERLHKTYQVLGRANDLMWAETPLPHALALDSRMAIYNWFGRSLKGETQPVRSEPETQPYPEDALRVTDGGSTRRSLGSETPFSLMKKERPAKKAARLEELLGVSRPARASAQVRGRVETPRVRLEAWEVVSDAGVTVPAWVLLPAKRGAGTPVLLSLDPQGREELWFASELENTPEDLPVVCAADVRGIGDLTPEFSPGAAEYARWHQAEENYAWSSLIFGRPLAGQRVTDILAVVAAVAAQAGTAGRPIRIAARGKLTVPALFAAALEPRIAALYLAGGLVSFESVIESETYSHPLANFVPGLLNHTDLPEVAASLDGRPIVLAGPVDASGAEVPAARARELYPSATVGSGAEWNAAALMAWARQADKSATNL